MLTSRCAAGVREVQENTLDELQAAVPLPLAPTSAKLSAPNKVKRDLQYATQVGAVSELVFISQPT